MPVRNHPYLSVRFAAMAHRGGWIKPEDALRENTGYAFRRAVELGYSFLETDVHATSDGELVVFHDAVLDRLTDLSGRIADRSWVELSEARIAQTEPIPRFAQLLEEFAHCRFNVDLKGDGAIRPLAEVIRLHGARDRVCVCSFSRARLRAFRRVAPDVLTAYSPGEVAVATHAPVIRRVLTGPGRALQVPIRHPGAPLALVRPDVIRSTHARGGVVHVWTINDEAEMHRLIDLGVDGLVTDDIVTLKRVLEQRGLWDGR